MIFIGLPHASAASPTLTDIMTKLTGVDRKVSTNHHDIFWHQEGYMSTTPHALTVSKENGFVGLIIINLATTAYDQNSDTISNDCAMLVTIGADTDNNGSADTTLATSGITYNGSPNSAEAIETITRADGVDQIFLTQADSSFQHMACSVSISLSIDETV